MGTTRTRRARSMAHPDSSLRGTTIMADRRSHPQGRGRLPGHRYGSW